VVRKIRNPSSTPRVNAEKPDNRLLYVIVSGVVLLGLALRLYGLSATGIGGNDTIYYYSLAERWLAGDITFQIAHGAHVFRPVFLAFNALALAVFGQADYAIKLANILLDGGSMVMLAGLAWTVSRQWSVVIASVLSYACLPIAIWASRQELPHTLSTFLVLLTFVLFVRSLSSHSGARRYKQLVFAGLSLGAAVMTHEELALLAVPLGAFLLAYRHTDTGSWPRAAAKRLAAFLLVPAFAVVGIYIIEADTVEKLLGKLFSSEAGSNISYPELASRYLWNVVAGTTSAAFAILAGLSVVVVILAYWVKRGVKSREELYWAAFFLIVPLVFVAIYAPFFNTIFSRGYLPMVPMAFLGVFLVLAYVTAQLSRAKTAAVFVPVLAFLLISNLASYSAFAVGNRRYAKTWAQPIWPTIASMGKGIEEFLIDARYVASYATHWHHIYAALAGKVGPSERLLVLPITTMYSPGRRALQTNAYFGDDVVFRVDFPGQTIAEIVNEKEIRWVLFTTGQQRKVPKRLVRYQYNGEWSEAMTIDLARDYGFTGYSVNGEFDQLLAFLRAANAIPQSPFQADSFEQRVARVWYLPPKTSMSP
jgi:4-amino-4-deoxy-L-arabinose transferase-like glycosyltransferase